MKVTFHPEAEAEFLEAIDYYEECATGLGFDFASEIYSSVERIGEYPTAWPVVEEEIRRSLVNRFPYGILYAAEASDIFVVAVMHLHREPGYWRGRSG